MVRRGEIYWITPRDVRGREQRGRRPALIVQSDMGNESSDNTIVALMSGQRFSRDYPFHVHVSRADSGLSEDSTVLLEQLQTVAIERLGRPVGQLDAATMRQVDRAIHDSLGLVGCLLGSPQAF